MFSSYGEAFEVKSARKESAWQNFRELGGVLVVKLGLPLEQRCKIYQTCVRLVLLYSSKTWELISADELRLYGVESGIWLGRCAGKTGWQSLKWCFERKSGSTSLHANVAYESCLGRKKTCIVSCQYMTHDVWIVTFK